ncbi:MAG: regulatory iron-sulfur-containing complex subunit RicT, partial [Tuberibacillus sp.]
MFDVVGVRFKKAGKIYYFDPGEWELSNNDPVIVETTRGIEFGKVVIAKKTVGEDDVVQPLRKVLRPASEEDRIQVEKNRNDAKVALKVCSEKIEEHGLDMKLVDVEYTFDRNKIIFYFTA